MLRTRVHALIAMLAAACIAGLLGGMGIDKTLSVITSGFGTTLGSIGMVIGLGVMMGALAGGLRRGGAYRLALYQMAGETS